MRSLTRIKKFFAIIGLLFKKYRKDNAHIIVSSIAFYVLLTFIPFTLLGISILGHIIDLSDLDDHFMTYLQHVLPEPYNLSVVFYGTYGLFIGFLLWIYYSVFVFVSCAELQSVLLKGPIRAPAPSSSLSRP